jgi:hypothetical protein
MLIRESPRPRLLGIPIFIDISNYCGSIHLLELPKLDGTKYPDFIFRKP